MVYNLRSMHVSLIFTIPQLFITVVKPRLMFISCYFVHERKQLHMCDIRV